MTKEKVLYVIRELIANDLQRKRCLDNKKDLYKYEIYMKEVKQYLQENLK